MFLLSCDLKNTCFISETKKIINKIQNREDLPNSHWRKRRKC